MKRLFAGLDLQDRCIAESVAAEGAESVARLVADGPAIARGSGLSFVAQSFGAGVRTVAVHGLDRVLEFDPERRRIRVEAGMTLGALYDFLSPHGLYVPSQPGHPQISVGGCVANNVHGKNPERDGLFADAVESLELFHPDHGTRQLSRHLDPEVFDLTCGGFGLTGVILRVTLRLSEIPATAVRVRRIATVNLEDTCERIQELRQGCDFLYSWSNVATANARLGGGYVCCGTFVDAVDPVAERLPSYRRLPDRSSIPRWPRLMRPLPIRVVAACHRRFRAWRNDEVVELARILYPGMFTGDFYFNLYGSSGFFAHMVLVPFDRWRRYVRDLDAALRRHSHPMIALAMKVFDGEQRLLHFNGRGLSMHMHVSNTARGRELLATLESLSRDYGLIRTIYFDSRLSVDDARLLYAGYDDFRTRLHRYDPRRRFTSGLSQRLCL